MVDRLLKYIHIKSRLTNPRCMAWATAAMIAKPMPFVHGILQDGTQKISYVDLLKEEEPSHYFLPTVIDNPYGRIAEVM